MVPFSENSVSSLIWILITLIWFLFPGCLLVFLGGAGELFGFRQVYLGLMKRQTG